MGRYRWSACSTQPRKRSNVDGPGREDRCHRALRGLRTLALPPLGAEEPETLDLRRRVPARLQRGRGRQRPLAHADPVPRDRRCSDHRGEGPLPARCGAPGRPQERAGRTRLRRRVAGRWGAISRLGGSRRAGGRRVGSWARRPGDAGAHSDLGSRRGRGGAAGGVQRRSGRGAGAKLAFPGGDGGGRSRTCARRSVQAHGEGYELRAVGRPGSGGDARANARLDAYHLEGRGRRVRLAHGPAGGTETSRGRVRERKDVAGAGGGGGGQAYHSLVPDHPVRLSPDSAGEPRRSLRRGGDRPATYPEHPQPHGRGEGGGARHRPAGARDPGPQRVAHRGGADGPARRRPRFPDAAERRADRSLRGRGPGEAGAPERLGRRRRGQDRKPGPPVAASREGHLRHRALGEGGDSREDRARLRGPHSPRSLGRGRSGQGDGGYASPRAPVLLLTRRSRAAGRRAMSGRILVAGIGNIFLGDDGFGCEVVRRLAERELPEGVEVVDFGIRGLDLAYALQDDYEVVVFVDAVPRGEESGTVYLIEPEIEEDGEVSLDTHGMDPVKVIRLARALGARPARILVVGCEPQVIPPHGGGSETHHHYDEMLMELSEPVRAAVEEAAKLVESLVAEVGRDERPGKAAGSSIEREVKS